MLLRRHCPPSEGLSGSAPGGADTQGAFFVGEAGVALTFALMSNNWAVWDIPRPREPSRPRQRPAFQGRRVPGAGNGAQRRGTHHPELGHVPPEFIEFARLMQQQAANDPELREREAAVLEFAAELTGEQPRPTDPPARRARLPEEALAAKAA